MWMSTGCLGTNALTTTGRNPGGIHSLCGRMAGFVLVRNLEESTPVHSIAEFFILRKYRRRGVGKAAAHQIFGMFPGQWRVAQTEDNHPAQAFWRKVISEYTQGNFKEIWSNDDEWKGPIQIFGTEADAISKPR